jgi:hypothetical protein
MTNAIPAGFIEGLPPANTKCVIEYESGLRMYAEIQTMHDDRRKWTESRNILRGFGSEGPIVRYFPIPPDPPPLPRRFRCVRKSDGESMAGSFNAGLYKPFALRMQESGDSTVSITDGRFHNEFTITEWIDPA